MNPDQLRAFFARNKKGLAIAGAAGVAGLALLRGRSGKPAAAAPSASAGALSAGGAPTASYPSSYTPGYDSTGSDVVSALQPQIEALAEMYRGQKQTTPIPVQPAASQMFKPNYTGNLVRFGDGDISEVQADGSLYRYTPWEWHVARTELGQTSYNQLDQMHSGTDYSALANTNRVGKGA